MTIPSAPVTTAAESTMAFSERQATDGLLRPAQGSLRPCQLCVGVLRDRFMMGFNWRLNVHIMGGMVKGGERKLGRLKLETGGLDNLDCILV